MGVTFTTHIRIGWRAACMHIYDTQGLRCSGVSLIYTVTRRSVHPPGQAGVAVRWHSIRPVSIGRWERLYTPSVCLPRRNGGAAPPHHQGRRAWVAEAGGAHRVGRRSTPAPGTAPSGAPCCQQSAPPGGTHIHRRTHAHPPFQSATQYCHARAAETARVWVRASQSSTNGRAQAANADEAR